MIIFFEQFSFFGSILIYTENSTRNNFQNTKNLNFFLNL